MNVEGTSVPFFFGWKAMNSKYNRILLKLSGEYVGGGSGQGFDVSVLSTLSEQIREIHEMGVQIAIVLGGGNFFRGTRQLPLKIDRVAADQIGMLATVMNAVCLKEVLATNHLEVQVMTGLEVPRVAGLFDKTLAVQWLMQKRILVLAGGTGNPFFSTDTAAVLRALEIEAEIVIKGTKVDGVFDQDPAKNESARKYEFLTFSEVLAKDLKIMDAAAIALCRENRLPLCVLSILERQGLIDYLQGKPVGTTITG